MAMEDAVALAQVMGKSAASNEAHLDAFQTMRRTRTARVQRQSREIGDHIYQLAGAHAELRNQIISAKSAEDWHNAMHGLYGSNGLDGAVSSQGLKLPARPYSYGVCSGVRMGVFQISRRVGARLAALALLAGCAVPGAEPPRSFSTTGARLAAIVYLSERGPDQAGAAFLYPAVAGGETRINIASTARRPFAARLSCTGPARLLATGEIGPGRYLRPGATRAVQVPATGAGRTPVLVLPTGTQACDITWGQGKHLPLRREGAPGTAAPIATPACAAPVHPPADPLARAFFAERDLDQTCARPTGAYALYPDEIAALQLRLERLTGARVPHSVVAQGDPEMMLDFSHAPRFDEIVVSYLHVRADISGYLVARALAFHAARGTKVRILVTDTLALATDRWLFQALAAQYPNVQLQYFRYRPNGFAPVERLVGSFRNSHHIKIFAGLSPQPGVSFALVGGRNLHDGFFYPLLENPPKLPFLEDYSDSSLNPLDFLNSYEDFEIGLFDRAVVADVMAQFERFWARDSNGEVMAPPAGEGARAPEPRRADGLVRHFLSLPWADGRAQEAMFVDVFDAARSEIVAVSPFFYPTPAIDAALLRAAARGVRVRIVSRYVSDEPPAIAVNALNTDYVNRRRDVFTFYAYSPQERLTHTKLYVVDERLAIVTSTNLNNRSFGGDGENGFVFLDQTVARDIQTLTNAIIARSEPFPRALANGWLGEVINAVPGLADQF